jgi:hypothetical protein
MTENSNATSTHTSNLLQDHYDLSKQLTLEDEIDYWQDKVLKLKLEKLKEDFEFEKNKIIAEKECNIEIERNSGLHNEIADRNNKIHLIKGEDNVYSERLTQIREEITQYEDKNFEMHNEFLSKINHIKFLSNPENLMKHLLKYDPETLKTLCIRLNKLQNEKLAYMMTMQQQYYHQMTYGNQNNQGMGPPMQMFPLGMPQGFMPNMNMNMKMNHNRNEEDGQEGDINEEYEEQKNN